MITKEDENHILKTLNPNDRVYHRNRMDELYKSIMKLRVEEHKKIKNKMNMLILEKKRNEELESKEKSKKTFMIRNGELLGLQKKKNHLIEKILKIKNHQKNEFNEEIKAINEYKKDFSTMGREEDELLQKINQISELQYEAFDQLEEVKKMEIDTKYDDLSLQSTKNTRENKASTRNFGEDKHFIRNAKYRSVVNLSSPCNLSKQNHFTSSS